MTYNVDILRSAQKRLAKVDDPIRRRIIDRIRALADDPRPAGCKKLSGRPAWRLRIGTYRVIYEVHDQKLLVLVVDVGHRREIYR
jgi:mRNA interferase RelE/StbE